MKRCFVCGIDKNLTFYKKKTIKKTGNPVTFKNKYLCKECEKYGITN